MIKRTMSTVLRLSTACKINKFVSKMSGNVKRIDDSKHPKREKHSTIETSWKFEKKISFQQNSYVTTSKKFSGKNLLTSFKLNNAVQMLVVVSIKNAVNSPPYASEKRLVNLSEGETWTKFRKSSLEAIHQIANVTKLFCCWMKFCDIRKSLIEIGTIFNGEIAMDIGNRVTNIVETDFDILRKGTE